MRVRLAHVLYRIASRLAPLDTEKADVRVDTRHLRRALLDLKRRNGGYSGLS